MLCDYLFLINFVKAADINTFWTYHFRTKLVSKDDSLSYGLNKDFVLKRLLWLLLESDNEHCIGEGARSRACMCTRAHETTLGSSCSKLQWWSMTVRIAHTIRWTSTLLQCYVWGHRIKRLKDTRSKVAKHYINLFSSQDTSISPCKMNTCYLIMRNKWQSILLNKKNKK